ncbi:phage tail-collar fiber protein (DUF3751 domain) [Campylobacter pinnipediorum subsp. pinnipediorum]|uniref:phage tail-collar fiber domain-containing protein n=1 Tax=Campylobacter pinnipediorum TaxID=1965231 RepID=UPI00084DEC62|nr:phage tail protein [Campylobacter pinnipediorum]AQW80796.1 phage tail-collar fiber protein (DUF3751 domain) [Campylobacter pinnipediorum subsp. pinnipediorum]OPA75437.1 hypothetical protein BFG05_06075 [Campylobacter pinnipediorum subsp. pinnipediorum]
MSGTMITNVGLSKLIQATSNNNTIQLTHMAVGDGQGEINQDMTSLQNEKHRFSINAITINAQDNHILDVEGVINASVGGFYIREAGIFCDDGSLFAIAKVAESYKPLLNEGSAKDITISFKIQVSNTNLINLVVDNNVVLATRKWVKDEHYTKIKTDELFLKTETAEQTYLKKTDTIDAYTKQEANNNFVFKSEISSSLDTFNNEKSNFLLKSAVTNSLTSSSTANALSANKGKELKELIDNLTSNLNNKADTSRSYSKSESDSRYLTSSKASNTYATKSELNNKADTSRSYTKSESDEKYLLSTQSASMASKLKTRRKIRIADTQANREGFAYFDGSEDIYITMGCNGCSGSCSGSCSSGCTACSGCSGGCSGKSDGCGCRHS